MLLINEKTGQKANIGIQFPERNDSFDFIGALDSYVKYLKIDSGTAKDAVNMANAKDFSLKEG